LYAANKSNLFVRWTNLFAVQNERGSGAIVFFEVNCFLSCE